MGFMPRFYQVEAVEATLNVLFNEPGENPLIIMPTGTGKAAVIGWLCKAILMRLPFARVMVCVDSQELVDQDASTMQRIWPEAPFGIYAAGLKKKQAAMPITFASIQSAVKNMAAFGKQNVLIIDEAHTLSPVEESNYRKLITELKKKNPKLVVVGLTATAFRMKQGMLTQGDNAIFTKVSYDISGRYAFTQLIDMGYLAPLIPKEMSFQFDVSKVRKVGGEFNQGDLTECVNKDELTARALEEAIQVAEDRSKILVFCAGIPHVESVVSMLQSWGEDAVFVHSKAGEARNTNLNSFKYGSARWMVNDGILTKGFDLNAIDCIVLLKPSNSPGLHVQILGRGTRPFYVDGFDLETTSGRLAAILASPKQNCLILDFAGNVQRLGPINDPRIPTGKKGKKTGEIPIKICPKCSTYQHTAVRFCDGVKWDGTACDHEFTFETKLEITAGTAAVVAREEAVMDWFKVDSVEYEKFTRPFAPAMMRVKYFCGMQRFTELVCVEHTTYAGKVARDWWRKRRPGKPPPKTTYEGMQDVGELAVPTHIWVQTNIKWPKVLAASFNGETPAAELATPEALQRKELA